MKSGFDGTWRPDYEAPGPGETPDVLSLADGIYECQSCLPPYRVAADGREHAIEAHPRFETLSVIVVDDRTVRLVGRRSGAISYESTMVVASDADSMSETRTAAMIVGDVIVPIMTPMAGEADGRRPVLFRMTAARIGSPTAGAHLLSGTWKVVELDLLNHDEDTTYRIVDDSLTMSDRMGRSYTARLDGSIAPYHGDPRFTGVSLRRIDERTIEESNLSGDTVVQVTRWRVNADGRTMHVRFDDTHGHVMEQTGHKIG
jgi:hypothetical protein